MQPRRTPLSILRPPSASHFFPGYRGALTAHDLQILKLTPRIHCKLRHKTPRTLAASRRTLIKDLVIHHGQIAADYFGAFLVATGTRLLLGADRTFVERDTEAPLQFVAQIDPPPTHDTVHRRVGTGLDKLGQFGLLPRREF
jgi:hypothetical protein